MSRKFKPQDVSRALSKALRHDPGYLDLPDITDGGWAPMEAVLEGLRAKGWADITAEQVETAISWGDKRRMEIVDGRIRAMQGHSIDVLMDFEPLEPPAVLYHGTAEATVPLIQESGILSMNRQYVHLSSDTKTAKQVGARHGKPVVLTVYAKRMHEAGCVFHRANNGVWLTDHVAAEYVEVIE